MNKASVFMVSCRKLHRSLEVNLSGEGLNPIPTVTIHSSKTAVKEAVGE